MSGEEKYIKIPLINTIEGISLIEEGVFTNYKVIYHNKINGHTTKKIYAYKVKDDTMRPRICKGDIIIFEKTKKVDNGDTCVIKIANEEGIVRKVEKYNEHIILKPLNLEYSPTIYKKEDLNKIIKVIGKVITVIGEI